MLAIIIPYYKLTFFEDTLVSLTHQTDKRFKLYIGDDASPENPSKLLDEYKDKLNFHYHRFKENIGSDSLVKQWDRCIDLTEQEEWIMILGDDDYLDINFVSSWYKNYNNFSTKTNIIRFATKLIDERKCEISKIFKHSTWEEASDSYLKKINFLTRSSLSEYVFSRKSYEKFGFKKFPLAWNSDDCAWLEFSDNKPIYTINESIVFIRNSDLNISGKDDNINLKINSQVSFYKFIISKKNDMFKKQDILKIMRKYENEILKTGPLNASEWFFLFCSYLRYFNFESFKNFSKRFVKTILNKM